MDVFVVYTDNETWAGEVHPHQALRAYRQRTGIPARLDIAGFDAAVPGLIAEFARG